MKQYILLILLSLIGTAAFSQDAGNTNLWTTANTAYEAQQYDFAIDQYEKLAKLDSNVAEVFYNLGNAYFRDQQKGKAVVNYLRALKLKPNFTEAKENITFVQSQAPKAISDEHELFLGKIYQNLLHLFSFNVWAIIFGISIWLTAWLIYKNTQKRTNYSKRWLAFGLSLSALFLFITIASFQSSLMKNTAVVVKKSAFLFKDAKKSKVLLTIPEGSIISIEENTQKELISVRLANGFEGWMDKNDMEKI